MIKPRPVVLYMSACYGLGDDVMSALAFLVAEKAGLVPSDVRIFFENQQTKTFIHWLFELSGSKRLLDECDVVQDDSTEIRYRVTIPEFKLTYLSMRRGFVMYSTHFHMKDVYRGNRSDFRLGALIKFAVALLSGRMRIWPVHKSDLYVGWQEISMMLDYDVKGSYKTYPLFGREALSVLSRIKEQAAASLGDDPFLDKILLFPSGNSHQTLGGDLQKYFEDKRDSVLVAQHSSEQEKADLRYDDLIAMTKLLLRGRAVVTVDSISSHLAQVFSKKHLLLASFTRPQNVLIPEIISTKVVDLGEMLQCRPCQYYKRNTNSVCPAGYRVCMAYQQPHSKHLEQIERFLCS